jgi:hypothetical protein
MANPDVTGIMNAVIVVVVTKSSAEPTYLLRCWKRRYLGS